jgi:hypothetical protein
VNEHRRRCGRWAAFRASAHEVPGDLRFERAAMRSAVSAPVTHPGRGLSRRTNVGKPLLVAGVADALIDELRSTSGWSGQDDRPQEINVVTSDSTLADRVRDASASAYPAASFRNLVDPLR